MFDSGLLLALILAAMQYKVAGQVILPAGTTVQRVQIESTDHKVVKSDDLDSKGRFSFKVHEGLYKITVSTSTGRSETRTIEVRASFADEDGRLPIVKIEILEAALPAEPTATGGTLASVSPKAVDEFQRARDAGGKSKKAREHLEKALAIAPNYPDALNGMGMIYVQEKQYGKAAELFRKAIAASADFYPSHVNLGNAFLSLGDYESALIENQKAVQMRPNDSVAQSQLGQALFHLKRYDDALPHLELAKQLDPMSFTLPGLFIAQIYQAKGDSAAALAEYKEFLKMHPGHEYVGSIQNEVLFLEKQTQK